MINLQCFAFADKFKPVTRPVEKPLRIMLSDVFKGMGAGFTATGKIAAGSVQLGDRVAVMPASEYAAVKGQYVGQRIEVGLSSRFSSNSLTRVPTVTELISLFLLP